MLASGDRFQKPVSIACTPFEWGGGGVMGSHSPESGVDVSVGVHGGAGW
jgi:hypothetical protein